MSGFHGSKFNATKVIINGIEYKLGKLHVDNLSSKTGFSYFVLNAKNQPFRIVNAYPKGTKVFVSGESLEFK